MTQEQKPKKKKRSLMSVLGDPGSDVSKRKHAFIESIDLNTDL